MAHSIAVGAGNSWRNADAERFKQRFAVARVGGSVTKDGNQWSLDG